MVASASGSSRATVVISGEIGPWGENNLKRINDELADLDQEFKEITFLLNSNGGSVAEGVAMYHAIQSVKAETTGIVVGVAASMAFFLLQAFDKRGMRKMTRAMSHKISGGSFGSAKKMKEMAELMEKWEEELIGEISERSGQDKETVQAWFTEGEDKWFTPDLMLENGLIDFIDNEKAVKAPAAFKRDAGALFNHFEKEVVGNLIKSKNTIETTNMKKEHLALIGLSEGASDETIADKLNELASNAGEAKQMIENNAKSIAAEAVKAGKLRKDQEAFAVQLLVEKPKEGIDFLNSLSAAIRPSDLILGGAANVEGKKKQERKNWTLDDYIENGAVDELSDEDYLELENKK